MTSLLCFFLTLNVVFLVFIQRFLAPHSEWLTASRTYSMASDATIDLRPTREYVYEQCWQLLILCCSLFVPRGQVLWFLKLHLQRQASKG